MKPSLAPRPFRPPPTNRRPPRSTLPPLRVRPLPAWGEDVLVDRAGRPIVGLADGRILRIEREGSYETLADTRGRPLGLEFDEHGRLIICDARRGLLRLDLRAPELEVLAEARTHGLGFCNNASVARDGTIYFSDSSQRFGIDYWRGELFEHSGTGRLLARRPEGKVEVLLGGLQFANGVALAQDETFVAVAETGRYCISRLFLSGPKQGQSEVWIDGLPGFPDNMAVDARGLFWVAIASPRNPLLDLLHRANPLLKQLAWQIPDRLQPQPDRTMRVMAYDQHGSLVYDLGGRSEHFHMITGMRAHGDTLFLASLEEAALAELTLP